MTASIFVVDSILTSYLRAGLDYLTLFGFESSDRFLDDGFVVIETGHIADLVNHVVHPDAGIAVRSRGTVMFQSAVRGDELESPTIWLRTSSITTELVARATIGPYFGFRPGAWVGEVTGPVDAVVVDELTALAPIESGFREDLAIAWFVLTGLPLVAHVLAVPISATGDQIDRVAGWMTSAGGLDKVQRQSVHERIATEVATTTDDIAGLMTGITWTMGLEERRATPELFARSGLGSRYGPVKWLS